MKQLEAESIEIIREAVATARNPVMMYSVGKDSSVMLHLARKAFYPAPPPFPLLHVDTQWKFKEMYAHRERMVKESGVKLLTHTNPEGIAQGVGPFTHGSGYHTDVMKTQALKQALDLHKFDLVFGGARRDEEKSRAKERVFSFRSAATAGIRRHNARNCGTCTMPASNRTKASASSRSAIGPNRTSGTTSCKRRSPSCRCTSRPNARW
jgi:sulfate adenylyltransferase subunit 2